MSDVFEINYPGDFGGPVTPSIGFNASVNPLAALASGLPGVAEVSQQKPGASLTDILGTIANAYALDRQQRAFLDLNSQLIQQGRNPISWEQFGASAAVGVQVDKGTQNTVLIVGLALAGALVLGALLKRR